MVASKITLEQIPKLCQAHCKIRNPEYVENLINEFITEGAERLQVVSDFDFTLTKQHLQNDTPVLSSFRMFSECVSLPEEYIINTRNLHVKYRPIEIDPRIPSAEKIEHMTEWWEKSSDILVGFPFDLNDIEVIASKYKHTLRDQAPELFATLHRLDVPVLVFSAGLGNLAVSLLRHANVLYPNVKVISNFLQYKNGLLNGFQRPIIHIYNKNETVLQDNEYRDLVKNRDNVIVMGDSIGDGDMAKGVSSTAQILKIGFLYHHVEENLDEYMNTFDIVLIDDQSMDVPLAIIDIIKK